MSSVNFVFIRKRRARKLRKIWPPSYFFFYRQWHKDAYRFLLKNDNVESYDLVHQLTMVGFREPGFFWKLNIPFVWGPVGGGGYFPIRFLMDLELKWLTYYLCYNFINFVHVKLLIRSKLAAKKAGVGFLVATRENQLFFQKHWNKNSIIMPEVGFNYHEELPGFSELACEKGNARFNVVWCGQLIPRKGLIYALKAVKAIQAKKNIHLHVIGDGPLYEKLIKETQKLGLSHRVTYYGAVDRTKALSTMKKCDLGIITSLRDLTSTVLLEYLSLGKPVIAPNHCGFSDILDSNCGYLVDIHNPEKFVSNLATTLQKILDDPKTLNDKSRNAKICAQHHYWNLKITKLNQIYNDVKYARN